MKQDTISKSQNSPRDARVAIESTRGEAALLYALGQKRGSMKWYQRVTGNCWHKSGFRHGALWGSYRDSDNVFCPVGENSTVAIRESPLLIELSKRSWILGEAPTAC